MCLTKCIIIYIYIYVSICIIHTYLAALDLWNFQRFRGTKRFILKALCRQAVGISMSLRLLRRIFGRPHTRQSSRTSNKRARYRWPTKKRIGVAFESKKAAKCEGLRETSARLPITCVKHWSLPSVANC